MLELLQSCVQPSICFSKVMLKTDNLNSLCCICAKKNRMCLVSPIVKTH